MPWLRKRIFTRGQKFRRLQDSDGRRTFYVRGRTSPWQVRVYTRRMMWCAWSSSFRRSWLRKAGINRPENLEFAKEYRLALAHQDPQIEQIRRVSIQRFAGPSEDGRVISRFQNSILGRRNMGRSCRGICFCIRRSVNASNACMPERMCEGLRSVAERGLVRELQHSGIAFWFSGFYAFSVRNLQLDARIALTQLTMNLSGNDVVGAISLHRLIT